MYFKALENLTTTYFKIVGEDKRENIFILVDGAPKRLSDCTPAQQSTIPPDVDILAEQAIIQSAFDTTQYMRTRLRRYAVESDLLFLEWQGLVADSDGGADAKKAEWLAARSTIKAEEPKP